MLAQRKVAAAHTNMYRLKIAKRKEKCCPIRVRLVSVIR